MQGTDFRVLGFRFRVSGVAGQGGVAGQEAGRRVQGVNVDAGAKRTGDEPLTCEERVERPMNSYANTDNL